MADPSLSRADAAVSPKSSPRPAVRLALRHLLGAVLLLGAFCAGVGTERFIWTGAEGARAASSFVDSPEFAVLQRTWDLIHGEYVAAEDISDEELVYGAARGMVDALGDTGHSRFLDPEEARDFEDQIAGEFVGIGVQLDVTDGRTIIVAPVDGSPADEAGLRGGDVIVGVNGESIEGLPYQEVSDRLDGDEGERVTLRILRPGKAEPFDVTLTRRKLTIDPVSWRLLPERVAHIRLSEFSAGATDGIKEAVAGAREVGATSIVLDMRDNPGGLVFEAIGVASQFMPEGMVIYQEQARDGSVKEVKTLGGGVALDLPMAVLVNGNSASAAEIVGGALRDNGRARLIGETTFGTGTVLIAFPYDDGSAAVLGTALWLTADGDQVWKRGVEPDETVELPDGVYPSRPSDDPQVTQAELRRLEDEQLIAAHDEVS